MKRVKYVGARGPSRIEVLHCGKVKRGETLDVPDEVADGLCKRPDDWKMVKPGKSAGTERKA